MHVASMKKRQAEDFFICFASFYRLRAKNGFFINKTHEIGDFTGFTSSNGLLSLLVLIK